MKYALLGHGYWGKIIEKTLRGIRPHCAIDIFDVSDPGYKGIGDIGRDYDAYFVATPASTHEGICRELSERKTKIFCEKPLLFRKTLSDVVDFYDTVKKNGSKVWVDYLYVYSEEVGHISNEIWSGRMGKLRGIHTNRLNKGPVRGDVSPEVDLTSHDYSIITTLIGGCSMMGSLWKDGGCSKEGADFSFLSRDETSIDIRCYSSWSFPFKVREIIFEFDDGFLVWDDNLKTVKKTFKGLSGESVTSFKTPPLNLSIKGFLNGTNAQFDHNKRIVSQVSQIIS